MIFSINQWDQLINREFYIGAGPIGPKELSRNGKYVFALPARYNFAFPTGYEEVEEILEGDPLEPIEISGETGTYLVSIYYACSKADPGSLSPVVREVPADADPLKAALEHMLKGPSSKEIELGYHSYFSEKTEGMLRGIKRSGNGKTVTIDFADFSNLLDKSKIPSPTSFGAGGIMADITWTVFKQFPQVQTLRFSFEGDEAAFWNWLAGGEQEPEVFTRTDWEQI